MDGNYEAGGGLREFLEEAELTQYDELFRAILKVNKLSQLKYVEVGDLSHIGLSKPEQRRYKSVYNKHFPNPYFTVLKRLLARNRKNDMYLQGQESMSMFPPLSENAVRVPTKHIISVEDITINKELGMGQFGVVQQGTWTTGNQRLQVAIKCLGQERMTSNSTEFLKEAAVMHSIEHPNIVRLYGVVLHMDSLMLVTELAPLRSLLECLREVSLRPNFPVPTLCEFAEQICSGMTYLERKRLIHRDLAARNILVFNKDRIKISDFGLSRALGVGKDYYQTNYNVNLKLPVAWCAPECILYLRFTTSSDVWAYGVCLWEMFTYGFQPWAAFSGQQILEAIDAPNYHRLERPECCPEGYYKLMLSCWAQEPNDRPKFKDMEVSLRDLMPEQVQAIADSCSSADEPRTNELEYKSGQIITVLGKGPTRWYGVVPGGACGYFNPKNIMPKKTKSESSPSPPGPSRARPSSLRPAMLRGDVTRHTTGRRTLHRSMISSPQGEVRHTGHVGLDGAYFGDISFLDPAGCPPQQVVTPYRPSEDLEQVPLLNPHSPSHATGATSTPPPYPLLSTDASQLAPVTSAPKGGLLSKVKSSTLMRSLRSDSSAPAAGLHEYHEISDTDTESTATETVRSDQLPPDSPTIHKSDFSQSLLDEMETMFKTLDAARSDCGAATRAAAIDNAIRSHTLNKLEKKKGLSTGTMKPMSAHDKKTLDSAVALANEITTRSMNDLGSEQKPPASPGDKSKFYFRFPSLSMSHHQEEPKEQTAKAERRNFSQEAASVPDIVESLTAESLQAYTHLIEEPSRRHLAAAELSQAHYPAARAQRTPACDLRHRPGDDDEHKSNNVPPPPRGNKPKLVDKPRHIRRYPLVGAPHPAHSPRPPPHSHYVNFTPCHEQARERAQYLNVTSGQDVCDGVERVAQNPFQWMENSRRDEACALEPGCEYILNDHVSVEDLLEFADQKPNGRQRGLESDEVRIMAKVLKDEVPREECLEALELCEWSVHTAIKLLRVRAAAAAPLPECARALAAATAPLPECARALAAAAGDVPRAAAAVGRGGADRLTPL